MAGDTPDQTSVPVEQVDRDAAADFAETMPRSFGSTTVFCIRDGQLDGIPIVQAIARHRLAALSPAQGVREAIRSEIINTPETADFMSAVPLEAAHQRDRWGSEHDAGKAPEDWLFLVGYLSGKACAAARLGDAEKAKHHTISTAAALANWHASLTGAFNVMRPGIDGAALAPPADSGDVADEPGAINRIDQRRRAYAAIPNTALTQISSAQGVCGGSVAVINLGPCQHEWAYGPTTGSVSCLRCNVSRSWDTPEAIEARKRYEATLATPPSGDTVSREEQVAVNIDGSRSIYVRNADGSWPALPSCTEEDDEATYTRWIAGDDTLSVLPREQLLRFQARVDREIKKRSASAPVERGDACRFIDCPPGLFRWRGLLCFKSEYSTKPGQQDAYCCDSGEYFWGGTSGDLAARRELVVQPITLATPPAGDTVSRKEGK